MDCVKILRNPDGTCQPHSHLASFDTKEANHDQSLLVCGSASNRVVVIGVCRNGIPQQRRLPANPQTPQSKRSLRFWYIREQVRVLMAGPHSAVCKRVAIA